MTRERVLAVWKDFKKRYLKGLDLLCQATDGLDEMGFKTSSLGIKKTPSQVMEELKKRLPSITQHCQELRSKYRGGQFGDPVLEVAQVYIDYIELVLVYEKIIEYYEWSSHGPNIEEVD